MRVATPHRSRPWLAGALTLLLLSACGGGSTASAPAVTTALSGQVVKGPVNGAQVCAFSVINNSRGNPLGACTTTTATGGYTLNLPVGSGPVWVEATGGTYTDEATGNTTSLPAPMTVLVDATGGTVTAMVTPLTSLALNAARQAASTGSLNEAALRTAVNQLISSLGLTAGLDLVGTAPVVGAGANDYGQALAAVSELVRTGPTLAALLGSANPGDFSAAYATALATVRAGGGGGGGDGDGGEEAGPGGDSGTSETTGSASGSVLVGTGTFTPQATGFEVEVASNTGVQGRYRFFRTVQRQQGNVTVTETQQLVVEESRTTTNPSTPRYSYRFDDSTDASRSILCTFECDVRITPAAGATHPVTITIGGSDTTEPVRGTLFGDATDAWWTFDDVPATTAATLTRNDTPVTVRTASVSDEFNQLNVSIELDGGRQLTVNRSGSGTATVAYFGGLFCFNNCGMTVSSTPAGATLTFNNTTVGSNQTGFARFNGTVVIGRTQGSLTSPELGALLPVSDVLTSLNGVRTYRFLADVSAVNSTGGISTLVLTAQSGRVTRADVTARLGQSMVTRVCGDGLSALSVGACTGVTLGADGRTVTFNGTTLFGTAPGAASASLTGTVVARGR